ncbi:MAG: PQQ-binding-like beta-propeller repeat protein [Candidatus Cloacimonetes bacterium]|nr:PQQ-binding-like beta-propeller repeat protein [Candidatus Cloacimonadota bacterium]
MITLQSKFSRHPQSICEIQTSKDGRYGWFLCAAHEEEDVVLEEIMAMVKLEIMAAKVLEIGRIEIESWLKSFFQDFHWKLHASLRRTDLKEKGLSLFFAVSYDHDIYFVQFGRIFCAATEGKKLKSVGKNWKNHHIQPLQGLNLLGLQDQDINVRPQKFHLDEDEILVVLPGRIAESVCGGNADASSLRPLVESFQNASPALWLLLKHSKPLAKPRKRRLTKLEISTLILLLGTTLAILYMALGGRGIVEHGFMRVRLWFTGKTQPKTAQIIENIGKAVNSPARSMELNVAWSVDLPQRITAAPAFSKNVVYVASENTVRAYKPGGNEPIWETALDSRVNNLLKTVYSLQASLENGMVLGLDQHGKVLWEKDIQARMSNSTGLEPIEITQSQDMRLDKSITLIPKDRGIAVLDNYSGGVMHEITLDQDIDFISPYDLQNRCFYVVSGNILMRLDLDITN